jgi:hypothetical protein
VQTDIISKGKRPTTLTVTGRKAISKRKFSMSPEVIVMHVIPIGAWRPLG